jgi:hypothetical protein
MSMRRTVVVAVAALPMLGAVVTRADVFCEKASGAVAIRSAFSTAPFVFSPEPAGDSDKARLSPEYGKLLAQAPESGKVRVVIGVKAAHPRAKAFDLEASRDARATLIAAEPGLDVNRNFSSGGSRLLRRAWTPPCCGACMSPRWSPASQRTMRTTFWMPAPTH